MDTRRVYQRVGFAVVALCGIASLHDLLAGPTPQAQVVSWSAAAVAVTIPLLRPRPRIVRLAGGLVTLAGIVTFSVEPLRSAGMVLLLTGVLLTTVADLLLRATGAISDVIRESDRALHIVRKMEHADPADYDERPSRTRVLEAYCLHPHLTSKDIAALLGMSSRTVDNYLQRWIDITGVDNRRHLLSLFEYHYLDADGEQEGREDENDAEERS